MRLVVKPISLDAFAQFGDVIDVSEPSVEKRLINNGTTMRFHRLSKASLQDGEVIISLFRGDARVFPFSIEMMERHPLGSQTFYPLQNRPWLAVVAADENGKPGTPKAFVCTGKQGLTYARNVWHHPLIALGEQSDFLVVDREGSGANLKEAYYETPYIIDNKEVPGG